MACARPSTSRMTAVILGAMMATGATGQDSQPEAMSPLDAAIAAGNWIRHHQVETEHGVVWPVVPDESEDALRILYSGTPGVILFLLELAEATGDTSWRADAARGADDLLASLPEMTELSLWTGIAGQGFTLHRTYLATGEEKYLEGARQAVQRLFDGATETEHGVRFNDTTDIIRGTAGIGLFLLYAADEMEYPGALALATRAGDDLVSQGRPVELEGGESGLKWAMTEEFPRLMPNFSHGTAGNIYYLFTLDAAVRKAGGETDLRFVDAMKKGAAYLASIANQSNDGFEIFHHEPEGENLQYYGYCHGPVGTSRLFVQVYKHGAEEAIAGAEAGARSLLSAGIPEHRPDGFWNNVGQCCGTAGVASFMLDLQELRPHEEYPPFIDRLHADVMERATEVELPNGLLGLKWIQAEHRVRPEFLQAQTGYMQGAAGVGLWLLQLDAAQRGREFTLQFPDSPY